MCDFEDYMLVVVVVFFKVVFLFMWQELGECLDFDERYYYGLVFFKELYLLEINMDFRKIDEVISVQCLDFVSGLVVWVGYVKC